MVEGSGIPSVSGAPMGDGEVRVICIVVKVGCSCMVIPAVGVVASETWIMLDVDSAAALVGNVVCACSYHGMRRVCNDSNNGESGGMEHGMYIFRFWMLEPTMF